MIDGLPRHSHYGEAIAMDKALVDPQQQDRPGSQPRPSMREWSPEVELLAAVFNRMNSFVQTQAEKDLKLKPWPTPLTAAELVTAEQRRQRRARLTERITEAQQRYREQHPE